MTDLSRDPTLLPARRVLAANTLWNLTGAVLPAAVGIVASPLIIRGLGAERFGLLTLAWAAIGYFSLFDLGLGRAVTKLAAERLHGEAARELRPLFWTASLMLLGLGVVAMLLPTLSARWIVAHGIKISAGVRGETLSSLYLLAAALPAVVLAAGFRGFLEGGQHFALVNAVRVPFGVSTFLIPLIVLRYSTSLAPSIAGLAAARVVAAIAYGLLGVRVLRQRVGAARPTPPSPRLARELLSFGAWVTVSNVIGPLMVTFDRFVVGALISVAMVTYYATPFQAVLQFLIVPTAVAAVLFPAFTAAYSADPARLRGLLVAGLRAVTLVVAPCVILVGAFAPDILRVWLGNPFPQLSSTVMRWLSLGVFANGLAQIPFALIQGVGRSDLTAKLHLSELPVYAAALMFAATRYGIDGVAIAWCLRAAADAAVLGLLAARLIGLHPRLPRGFVLPVAGELALVAVCFVTSSLSSRACIAVAALGAFSWIGWTRLLPTRERMMIVQRFRLARAESAEAR